MSSEPQTVPALADTTRTRVLIGNVAGWIGLVLLVGAVLYWAVTGSRDLVFNVALILGLLGLGSFGLLNPQGILEVVAGRGTRNIFGTALIMVLAIAILVAINVVYSEVGKRIPAAVPRVDLTAGQSNTLAPQSIKAAQDLTGTVTAYEFFDTSASAGLTSQRDADNLVKQYQKFTTRLKVQALNPDVALGLANQYGLTRYNVVVFDNGTSHQVAATNTENDFTNALLLLRNSVQKRIAILNIPSPLSFTGSAGAQALPASLAYGGLQKENDIVLPPYNLAISPTISTKDVDVLIVPPAAAKQPLSAAVVRAISDYLDAGGHVLLIGDPLAAPLPVALLQKYGLTESRGIVAENDPQSHLQQTQLGIVSTTYPSSPITANMGNVPTIFLYAEPIIVPTTTITGFTVTPFIQSTSSAAYVVLKPDANGQVAPTLDPTGPKPPYNIGVTVEKTVDSTGAITGTQAPKQPTTRLAIIGDYDFLSDQLVQQFQSGNLDLFYNTLNWLSQSEERISIRPKDTTTRQLSNPSALNLNLISWSTIVFLPALVLLGGGLVWWRRR